MNIVGQDKPPLDELVHYGVKGMQWGHRKAPSQRQLNKASRQRDRAERNASIDAARQRLSSGQTRRDLKEAKTQYKADKKVVGRREAKKKLTEARIKANTDVHLAQQTKSGAETVGRVLGVVGGVAMAAVLQAGVSRNMGGGMGTRPPIRLHRDATGVYR